MRISWFSCILSVCAVGALADPSSLLLCVRSSKTSIKVQTEVLKLNRINPNFHCNQFHLSEGPLTLFGSTLALSSDKFNIVVYDEAGDRKTKHYMVDIPDNEHRHIPIVNPLYFNNELISPGDLAPLRDIDLISSTPAYNYDPIAHPERTMFCISSLCFSVDKHETAVLVLFDPHDKKRTFVPNTCEKIQNFGCLLRIQRKQKQENDEILAALSEVAKISDINVTHIPSETVLSIWSKTTEQMFLSRENWNSDFVSPGIYYIGGFYLTETVRTPSTLYIEHSDITLVKTHYQYTSRAKVAAQLFFDIESDNYVEQFSFTDILAHANLPPGTPLLVYPGKTTTILRRTISLRKTMFIEEERLQRSKSLAVNESEINKARQIGSQSDGKSKLITKIKEFLYSFRKNHQLPSIRDPSDNNIPPTLENDATAPVSLTNQKSQSNSSVLNSILIDSPSRIGGKKFTFPKASDLKPSKSIKPVSSIVQFKPTTTSSLTIWIHEDEMQMKRAWEWAGELHKGKKKKKHVVEELSSEALKQLLDYISNVDTPLTGYPSQILNPFHSPLSPRHLSPLSNFELAKNSFVFKHYGNRKIYDALLQHLSFNDYTQPFNGIHTYPLTYSFNALRLQESRRTRSCAVPHLQSFIVSRFDYEVIEKSQSNPSATNSFSPAQKQNKITKFITQNLNVFTPQLSVIPAPSDKAVSQHHCFFSTDRSVIRFGSAASMLVPYIDGEYQVYNFSSEGGIDYTNCLNPKTSLKEKIKPSQRQTFSIPIKLLPYIITDAVTLKSLQEISDSWVRNFMGKYLPRVSLGQMQRHYLHFAPSDDENDNIDSADKGNWIFLNKLLPESSFSTLPVSSNPSFLRSKALNEDKDRDIFPSEKKYLHAMSCKRKKGIDVEYTSDEFDSSSENDITIHGRTKGTLKTITNIKTLQTTESLARGLSIASEAHAHRIPGNLPSSGTDTIGTKSRVRSRGTLERFKSSIMSVGEHTNTNMFDPLNRYSIRASSGVGKDVEDIFAFPFMLYENPKMSLFSSLNNPLAPVTLFPLVLVRTQKVRKTMEQVQKTQLFSFNSRTSFSPNVLITPTMQWTDEPFVTPVDGVSTSHIYHHFLMHELQILVPLSYLSGRVELGSERMSDDLGTSKVLKTGAYEQYASGLTGKDKDSQLKESEIKSTGNSKALDYEASAGVPFSLSPSITSSDAGTKTGLPNRFNSEFPGSERAGTARLSLFFNPYIPKEESFPGFRNNGAQESNYNSPPEDSELVEESDITSVPNEKPWEGRGDGLPSTKRDHSSRVRQFPGLSLHAGDPLANTGASTVRQSVRDLPSLKKPLQNLHHKRVDSKDIIDSPVEGKRNGSLTNYLLDAKKLSKLNENIASARETLEQPITENDRNNSRGTEQMPKGDPIVVLLQDYSQPEQDTVVGNLDHLSEPKVQVGKELSLKMEEPILPSLVTRESVPALAEDGARPKKSGRKREGRFFSRLWENCTRCFNKKEQEKDEMKKAVNEHHLDINNSYIQPLRRPKNDKKKKWFNKSKGKTKEEPKKPIILINGGVPISVTEDDTPSNSVTGNKSPSNKIKSNKPGNKHPPSHIPKAAFENLEQNLKESRSSEKSEKSHAMRFF